MRWSVTTTGSSPETSVGNMRASVLIGASATLATAGGSVARISVAPDRIAAAFQADFRCTRMTRPRFMYLWIPGRSVIKNPALGLQIFSDLPSTDLRLQDARHNAPHTSCEPGRESCMTVSRRQLIQGLGGLP